MSNEELHRWVADDVILDVLERRQREASGRRLG